MSVANCRRLACGYLGHEQRVRTTKWPNPGSRRTNQAFHFRPSRRLCIVLKLGAVSFGEFDAAENKELPSGMEPRQEYEVMPGDVLISRANVVRYVGACVYVPSTPPKLMLCDKIFRVRFFKDSRLLPRFLAEAMKLGCVREHIESRLTGTSPTMKNISKPALLDTCFPVPDAGMQLRVVDAIDEARTTAASKRAEATALRQSAWSTFESSLFTASTGMVA